MIKFTTFHTFDGVTTAGAKKKPAEKASAEKKPKTEKRLLPRRRRCSPPIPTTSPETSSRFTRASTPAPATTTYWARSSCPAFPQPRVELPRSLRASTSTPTTFSTHRQRIRRRFNAKSYLKEKIKASFHPHRVLRRRRVTL